MSATIDGTQYELTEEDIQKLIKSPFQKKLEITKQIADYYKAGGFNEVQMRTANKIFSTLVKDTEVKIRQALSEAIKNQPDIPRDIVLSLANDVQEVALPLLQFSDVLNDSDLVDIINSTHDVEKQKSISKRKFVSEDVSGVLIATDNEQVLSSLLKNEGAMLNEDKIKIIIDKFNDKEDIMGSMIGRASLPVGIIESLASKISDNMYNKLKEKQPFAFMRMDNLLNQSREMATMKVMGLRSSDAEYYKFSQMMDRLKIPDDLSPIYALCMGNISIFEVKMARITQTPVLNIRTLLQDSSNRGFKVLYKRAELPPDLEDAVEILINTVRKVGYEYSNKTRTADITKEIAGKIAEEISRNVEDTNKIKNLDYIMSLIGCYASGNL